MLRTLSNLILKTILNSLSATESQYIPGHNIDFQVMIAYQTREYPKLNERKINSWWLDTKQNVTRGETYHSDHLNQVQNQLEDDF